MEAGDTSLLTLTADIVSAHVANNSVSVNDITKLIVSVHGALSELGEPAVVVAAPETPKPAVTVRASVKPDRLICLEDGLSMKTLKRHLSSHHQLTPAQYREKWSLPHDYPMVAPDYRELRSALAKKIGLGRKLGQKILKTKVAAKS